MELDRRWFLPGAWAAAWVGGAACVVAITRGVAAELAALGVSLPLLLDAFLEAGVTLQGPAGWLTLAGLLALGLLPARLAPEVARPWFVAGLAQAALVPPIAWVAVMLPVRLAMCDCAAGDHGEPPGLLVAAAPALLLVALGLALVQAGAWARISWALARRPRAGTGEELLRAAVIAALPALVAAPVALVCVDALDLERASAVLLPPPVAAAGTVTLGAFVAALGLRLRRPAPAP